jgi:hypothetical protein
MPPALVMILRLGCPLRTGTSRSSTSRKSVANPACGELGQIFQGQVVKASAIGQL